jgi:hypothetical protein
LTLRRNAGAEQVERISDLAGGAADVIVKHQLDGLVRS